MEYYHNPRCTTSRKALDLLHENGYEPTIRLYLEAPPSIDELTEVVDKLGIPAHELVRKRDKVYKEKFKDQNHSDQVWIRLMTENPSIIERPILINGDRAVIGRPVENVLTIVP